MKRSHLSQIACLAGLLCYAAPAPGQVACFQYDGVLSCDSPGSVNVTIAPFTETQGVIRYRDPDRSSLTPYTVFAAPSYSSRDLNQAIAPLRPLPASPTISRSSPAVLLPSIGLPPLDEPFLHQYRGELPPDLDLEGPPMELR